MVKTLNLWILLVCWEHLPNLLHPKTKFQFSLLDLSQWSFHWNTLKLLSIRSNFNELGYIPCTETLNHWSPSNGGGLRKRSGIGANTISKVIYITISIISLHSSLVCNLKLSIMYSTSRWANLDMTSGEITSRLLHFVKSSNLSLDKFLIHWYLFDVCETWTEN